VFRAPAMPFEYDEARRSVALTGGGGGGGGGGDDDDDDGPLCLVHWNGGAKKYPSFARATALFDRR
jgi:hypothetical protein